MTRVRRFASASGYIGILTALAMLSGCAGSFFSRQPLPEVPPKVLLEQVRDHANRLRTFQGRGMFTVASGENAFRGTIRVLAKKPDSLWVKLEGPLGIDLVTARFTDGRVFYFSPWIKDAIRDSLSRTDFGKILPLGLDSLDVMNGLFGMPIPPDSTAEPFLSMSKERRHYVLNLGGSESLWIEPQGPVITHWEKRDGGGRTVWLYEAGQFTTEDSMRVPRRVRFSGSNDQELILFYEELKTNQPLKKGWCNVRIPNSSETPAL
jgi:hypothetical protein